MYKKVLCPVDFSPCSDAAVVHATELARLHRAALVLVHVSPPPSVLVSDFSGSGMTPYHPEPDARLEQITIADLSIPVTREHLVGLEGEAITKYAARTGCDLIVMGTHGYGGLNRLMLGSVATFVVRHAKCTTYVVKEPSWERCPT